MVETAGIMCQIWERELEAESQGSHLKPQVRSRESKLVVCCCGIAHPNNLNTHPQCVVWQASSRKALSPKLAQTGLPVEWKVFNHLILRRHILIQTTTVLQSHLVITCPDVYRSRRYRVNIHCQWENDSKNIRQWPTWIRAWSNLRNNVGGYDTCRHCY